MNQIKCKVVHSHSKAAWNVIGTTAGLKYKLARVPYVDTCQSDPASVELDSRERKEALGIAEALEIAEFICKCLNNRESIENVDSKILGSKE